MSRLRFRSVIEIDRINPYVLVSAKRAARIRKGWRKPLPVRVRVNGKPEKPWRINLMPVGDGSFYLYLHGDVRRASSTKVGDAVSVELEFDGQYRGGPAHPMPSWFRDALNRNRSARQGWSELIPSCQKEILRYFSRLKTPAAQARNVQRAMHVLSGGKGRFMGRSWNEQPKGHHAA
ncbi:MAG TPA: DUF1905 domain-containing protein [Candidatus Binatia bacterium]|jgi:hypothetical protein|nr:DUF1905 domain-containing protein [Candidatus Binatia bacterium]